MNIPIRLQVLEDGQFLSVKALLDSGCTRLCMGRKYVQRNNIQTQKLARPIPVYNADGTLNQSGAITEFTELHMILNDHVERIQFAVTDLGEQDVFIGYEWLKKHNPDVDWQKETLYFSRCLDDCRYITTLDELDGDPKEQV